MTLRKEENTQETFVRLYDEFMPKVFRYIHYKVNSEQLSEVLTSTVFEKALVNFGRYSNDIAKFSTWIFSIARNTVIDYYRTEGKRRSASLDEASELPAAELSPEEKAERTEERQRVRLCLAKLSSEEQEIIHLKFGAELNNRQIAKTLGLSESNVGTKLFRAVRKLRDMFNDFGNG